MGLKSWYQKRGLLISTAEWYGIYRASGLVSDFTHNVVTEKLPTTLTKTVDVTRGVYEVALLGLDALAYIPKQTFNFAYHVFHGHWSEFWPTFKEFQVLQNYDSIPRWFESAMSVMPGVTAESAHQAAQQLDAWSTNPANLVMGAGIIVAAEYFRRKRHARTMAPISEDITPLKHAPKKKSLDEVVLNV